MFGSFSEQNLLNLIILGVFAKKLPKFAYISKNKLMWTIFSPILIVQGTFSWKGFEAKKRDGVRR